MGEREPRKNPKPCSSVSPLFTGTDLPPFGFAEICGIFLLEFRGRSPLGAADGRFRSGYVLKPDPAR